MKSNKIVCKHENWALAGYPYEIDGEGIVRVSSIYEVYCKDCKNFVNLLSKEIINDKGLLKIGGL